MRYALRPRAASVYVSPSEDMDVVRPELPSVYPSGPRPTGVLDQHGQEYWAHPDPIGFVRFGET